MRGSASKKSEIPAETCGTTKHTNKGSGALLHRSSADDCESLRCFVAWKLSAQLKLGEKASQLTLKAKPKQRLPDTLTAIWDHSAVLELDLTLPDPTRVQEHHSTDLVPLVVSPHVVLSLGRSQLS